MKSCHASNSSSKFYQGSSVSGSFHPEVFAFPLSSSNGGSGKSSGFTPAFFIFAPHSPQYLTATQLMKWHFLQRKCSQVHRPGFSSHSDSSGGTSGRKIFAVFLPGSATVTRVIFLIFALDMRISSVPSLSRSNNAALISVHPQLNFDQPLHVIFHCIHGQPSVRLLISASRSSSGTFARENPASLSSSTETKSAEEKHKTGRTP